MQFFGQAVIDVAADKSTQTGTAEGSITIPAMTVGSSDASATDSTGSATPETTVNVSLPVTIETDGEAAVYMTYEFNDSIIETPKLVETWHSGKHVLSMYYPIESIIANYTNTFNVYLRITGGSGTIGIGDVIATVGGQSMAAKEAWDGKITIEEKIQPFRLTAKITPKDFTETVSKEINWVVRYSWSDTIQRQKVYGFAAFIETGGSA